MLTEASEYFSNMFNDRFKEATESYAKFPEDDPEIWELVIEWCYKGVLPSLGRPSVDTKFDEDVTEGCWIRLKLCCLAEKYRMLLLHNLAVDTIISFLRCGAPGPKLEFNVFETWCHYVYENTAETSKDRDCNGLRKLMSILLRYSLSFDDYHWHNHDMLDCSTNSTHDIDQLDSLASGIPDLLLDLFWELREKEEIDLRPWNRDPCLFHLHTPSIRLECPAGIKLSQNSHGKMQVAFSNTICSIWL